MFVAATNLWTIDPGSCDSAAKALDLVGRPVDIQAAAGNTPDPPTRDVLLGLHTAIESMLRTCRADVGAFKAAQAELAWQWSVTDRRLTELGVRP
jgi:hypothetical protein